MGDSDGVARPLWPWPELVFESSSSSEYQYNVKHTSHTLPVSFYHLLSSAFSLPLPTWSPLSASRPSDPSAVLHLSPAHPPPLFPFPLPSSSFVLIQPPQYIQKTARRGPSIARNIAAALVACCETLSISSHHDRFPFHPPRVKITPSNVLSRREI
ncbi:hypothetical protein OH77DRAFT_1428739 [Trametes cingulata]|nr:hypothetical protein OH77DRAFT_1428739 [Trametes cingulata]